MSDEQPQTQTPDAPTKAIAERAIVLVKRAADLDSLETEILSQRLGEGQEAAEAYLYVIEQHGGKPIVGASVDFVRQAVRQMNASGSVQLTVDDIPPIIEEVKIDGRDHVRALVRAVDKLTGEMKWALKEEARVTLKGHRNAHAATIALEKAERKALESHPSYNRKLVNKIIKTFLKKAGLDPAQFQIGTGSSAWSDIFGRAKKAGVTPDAVRAGVREKTGKGLSEVATPAEAKAAVKATDEIIPGVVNEDGVVAVGYSAEDVKTIEDLRTRSLEIIKQAGIPILVQRAVWAYVGSAEKTVNDYRRLSFVVQLLAVGQDQDTALESALKKWPKMAPAAV
jgi:hypothetical protein